VELLDELYSGVPAIGSPDIQAELDTSCAATAWMLLFVPGAVALVVEPILFVLADRHPKKWFVCGGLFAMALAAFIAAAAPNAYLLTAAIALAWVGSGSGVALGQAALVDARPHDRERALTQWALLGEIGDLLAPLLMAALAAFGWGWRVAYLLVGAMMLVWALLVASQRFEDATPEQDEEEPGVIASLRAALANRRLLFWLGAAALCDLLDEIVVVFAALYLRDELGASPIERAVVITAGVAGAIAGVLLADRLLGRVRPLRLLGMTSVACAGSYLAWLFAPSVWLSTTLFFVVGMTAAPMYPIASAQAYAALPGRSGTVNAAGHLFSPLVMALPWLLGVVADHAGLQLALALLLAQPLGLAAAAMYAANERSP
jgi:MFS family permease